MPVSESLHLCCLAIKSCPMDLIPPGFSVLGIPQARILGWFDISYFKGSPNQGIKPMFHASPA